MVVDRNADVLDARSKNVHDKGQATDLKIIEVALFFQQELCKNNPAEKAVSEQDSVAHPAAHHPDRFPVLLLSNDNVQLRASKSHGLPAFRFTDLFGQGSSAERLRRQPLTAAVFRKVTAGATRDLGESARKSLQGEFDGAVACVKHLLERYERLRRRLEECGGVARERKGVDVEFMEMVKSKLCEWEGLVKSYQNPSRVLR